MKTIQLLYPSSIANYAKDIEKKLIEKCYEAIANPKPFLENELGIAMFVQNMDVDSYLNEIDVLREQLGYSSIPHLRLLPLFIFDGSQDDPEELFEGKTGEFVEEIFSGEFKPYGWDISKDNNIDELVSIIEEQSEE